MLDEEDAGEEGMMVWRGRVRLVTCKERPRTDLFSNITALRLFVCLVGGDMDCFVTDHMAGKPTRFLPLEVVLNGLLDLTVCPSFKLKSFKGKPD